jgi:hypothetical protein
MSGAGARRVELLYFDGCPNHDALLPRLRRLVEKSDAELDLETRRIDTEDEARQTHFLGSPTVRIDGRDIEPGAEARDDYGLKCRLYRTEAGVIALPPDELLVAALKASG